MPLIKVAIFEDNKPRRDLLQLLLNSTEGMVCTGAYPDGRDAVKQLTAGVPDVVLMDIDMPNVDGIAALREIRAQFPGMKVLMQTVFENEDKIFNSILAGADGYILKKTPPAKLIDAIHEVMEGGAPMTPTVARQVLLLFNNKHEKVPKNKFELTERELEILSLLVQGFSYKMIAERCCISYPTVNTHISHIYSKLHVQSGTEAVAKAIQERIV
jgi:DNA-binding NarL/FixJ family response regulator